MKMLKMLTFMIFSIGLVQAEVECHSDHQQTPVLGKNFMALATSMAKIGPCTVSAVKQNKNILGLKCRTSRGAIFERVARNGFGESWKGPDGLIWSDSIERWPLYDAPTQREALRLCKTLAGILPTRADFERGEANGFREVLPNMEDRWYWSSTFNPKYSEVPYGFSGNYGSGAYLRESVSVRCVVR